MTTKESKSQLIVELNDCIADIEILREMLDENYKIPNPQNIGKLSYWVQVFDPAERLTDVLERIVECHGDEIK